MDASKEMKKRFLDLIFSVTEKVINREISTSRDIVHGVLKSAIKTGHRQGWDKLSGLNPEDYRYMMEMNPGVIDGFDDIRKYVIVEDSSIRRAGLL